MYVWEERERERDMNTHRGQKRLMDWVLAFFQSRRAEEGHKTFT